MTDFFNNFNIKTIQLDLGRPVFSAIPLMIHIILYQIFAIMQPLFQHMDWKRCRFQTGNSCVNYAYL